jgi:hypothetical protein
VGLFVNNEEHMLRALADTGSSSSVIIEALPQPHSSKQMTIIQPPGIQWLVSLLQLKNWDMLVTFSFQEFNLKKEMCTSWEFHVDDRSESSNTYDVIIGNLMKSPWTDN